jgi:hypothetical protein
MDLHILEHIFRPDKRVVKKRVSYFVKKIPLIFALPTFFAKSINGD